MPTPDGQCSLRAAVQEANALPGGDSIDIPRGLYRLTRGAYEPRGEDEVVMGGDLDVTDDLTVL